MGYGGVRGCFVRSLVESFESETFNSPLFRVSEHMINILSYERKGTDE